MMVSSTFYDLRQVRADLSSFIAEDLGYVPLLSELPSFPIDPDLSTVENCRRRVQAQADIFVLIVGGRYGSIPRGSELSVTNLEYLTARAKGIPIYVFISSDVLAQLAIWKRNKSADFSAVTDTPLLFDFVHQLRSESGLWVFPFAVSDDIVGTLRAQLAYLFSESLGLRRRFLTSPDSALLSALSPQSARILLERSTAWEFELFFQAWCDEVDKRSSLLASFDAKLFHGQAENVVRADAVEWIQTRHHELQALVNSANKLINVEARRAFGPMGEPGDPKQIVWTASAIGDVLTTAVEWARRVGSTRIAAPFDEVASEMARFPDNLIERLRKFPNECLRQVRVDIATATTATPISRTLGLELVLSNIDRYTAAMDRARARFKSGEFGL